MNAHALPSSVAATCTLSVVVPVFNEEAVLITFHRRLMSALATLGSSVEILYVDDGSSDRSPGLLQQLGVAYPSVSVLRLSRNFGKEAAITAGLEKVSGACVVVIDADLQHPPESIPAMMHAWLQGADVVNMRRRSRGDETWVKRTAARMFYRMLNRLSDIPIPEDVGDFRLFSRRAVDAINRLPERNRFMKGLFAWIGFRQVTLEFDCGERAGGHSKWRFRQLSDFAVEGITAFSVTPLKVASHVGLLSALAAFGYALYFLFKTLVLGDEVPGFPTLIVVTLLLGGLQLLAIGVMGEYLGRLSMESKRRPIYLVEDYVPARSPVEASSSTVSALR